MTGQREAELLDAANLLLDARRTVVTIDDLPAGLQPVTMDEVFFVQDRVAEAFGPVGGWKVGAASPEATPLAAPMPRAWIGPSGSVLKGNRYRVMEAEIAYLMETDLPARVERYSEEEVFAAVASCHPAIEVLESGLTDPTAAAQMSQWADMQMHGGFVYGAACADGPNVNIVGERVALEVDGVVRAEKTAGPAAGDHLRRLMVWLANEGAARTGGLKAGDWVTTGSWTGNTPGMKDSVVRAAFDRVGVVGFRFE